MNRIVTLIALSLVIPFATAQDGNSDREVAVKEVQWDFPEASSIPTDWKLAGLPFDEWLKTVTFSGCELLHTEQSDDFFIAVFRDDSHLILWKADRKDAFNNGGLSVRPVDPKAHPNPVLRPSKWATLNFKLVSPTVKRSGRRQGDATTVAPDFSGKLIVKASAGGKGNKSREIFSKEIEWVKDWKAPDPE